MLENDVLRRVYIKKICIPLYNNIYIEYSVFFFMEVFGTGDDKGLFISIN